MLLQVEGGVRSVFLYDGLEFAVLYSWWNRLIHFHVAQHPKTDDNNCKYPYYSAFRVE